MRSCPPVAARAAGNEPTRVAEVEQSHPVLRDPGLWRTHPVLPPCASAGAEGCAVLMRFENGTPLLLEQQLQTGKLLTFASPLDRAWNDLAIHPLFVQFMAEATAYLAGARAEAATATVGARAGVGPGAPRRWPGVRSGREAHHHARWHGQRTDRGWCPRLPGYYEVRGGGRSDFIAVNVDPRESPWPGWTKPPGRAGWR